MPPSQAPNSSDLTVCFELSRNDVKNTVIYGPNSEPIYYIETESRSLFSTPPTFVYRLGERSRSRELLATLEFHKFEEDIMVLNGTRQALNDVLPRRGVFNPCVSPLRGSLLSQLIANVEENLVS